MKKVLIIFLVILLVGCIPVNPSNNSPSLETSQFSGPTSTPEPQRPKYNPGEMVDYVAQSGDTLPALAARFNTTIEEIQAANPVIPLDATTMPRGMPMKIPIYYLPFWGTQFQILPDSQFVHGPATTGFNTVGFIASQPGWLKNYSAFAGVSLMSAAEIVNTVAVNYSISPRVLLALLDYQTGALSQPVPPSGRFMLGMVNTDFSGFYMQLIWAANILNNGYYGWRTGSLTEFEHKNGAIERPDPWQTAASVAFQYYFSRNFTSEQYKVAVGPDGVARTYKTLFGDPWNPDASSDQLIPTSLQQPSFSLPYRRGDRWTLTSGPHTGWGSLLLQPWAALDLAPSDTRGCVQTEKLALAVADGMVVRSETGVVMLDLDGDGNENTGWNILYLHIATAGRASVGRTLKQGDPIGYPSCEGGTSTGTHIHIARKYNGEWFPVNSTVLFNMDGWIAYLGNSPRKGTLIKGDRVVNACECSSGEIPSGN